MESRGFVAPQSLYVHCGAQMLAIGSRNGGWNGDQEAFWLIKEAVRKDSHSTGSGIRQFFRPAEAVKEDNRLKVAW